MKSINQIAKVNNFMNKTFFSMLICCLFMFASGSFAGNMLNGLVDKTYQKLGFDTHELFVAINKKNLDAVKKYLAGHDDALTLRNSKGYTVLHSAVISGDVALVKEFLGHRLGQIIDVQDNDGSTALLHAAKLGSGLWSRFFSGKRNEQLAARREIIILLLNAYASTHIANNAGDTALHYAEDETTAGLLIEHGADVNAHNLNGITVLHMANATLIPFLIKAGANLDLPDNNGNTPLHTAIYERAKALLEGGAKVNVRNKNGKTPLHFADHIKALLKAGVYVDSGDCREETALHHQIRNGNRENVEILLNNGASLIAQNMSALMPLHLALLGNADPEGRNEDIIKLLIESGANLDFEMYGDSPLNYMLKLVNADNKKSQAERVALMLINSGAIIDATSFAIVMERKLLEIEKIMRKIQVETELKQPTSRRYDLGV
jgi:ankyrin repeat protein